jgi:hypothetical protein
MDLKQPNPQTADVRISNVCIGVKFENDACRYKHYSLDPEYIHMSLCRQMNYIKRLKSPMPELLESSVLGYGDFYSGNIQASMRTMK